jgi:2-dehydro-3-deoxygalactonokinase
MNDDFIAVDWGTTNRRCYLVDAAGTVLETERDDRGVLAIEPGGFAQEIKAIQSRLGGRPMLMAGMIGSDRGWIAVPYASCPATIDDLARSTTWIAPGEIAIVPGVSAIADGLADVMRGEEVQLLGAVAAGMVPPDALLCQPGTHCKWARMEAGTLAGFTTTMTGEVFGLLAGHSLLAPQLRDPVAADADFLAGVEQARQGDLLASLFGVRAAAVLGAGVARGASFVSGLLIGADVAARPGIAGRDVHVLAEPALGALYGAAIGACGGRAIPVDSRAAFVAGMAGIWRKLS